MPPNHPLDYIALTGIHYSQRLNLASTLGRCHSISRPLTQSLATPHPAMPPRSVDISRPLELRAAHDRHPAQSDVDDRDEVNDLRLQLGQMQEELVDKRDKLHAAEAEMARQITRMAEMEQRHERDMIDRRHVLDNLTTQCRELQRENMALRQDAFSKGKMVFTMARIRGGLSADVYDMRAADRAGQKNVLTLKHLRPSVQGDRVDRREYHFDHVFHHFDTNKDVQEKILPLLGCLFEGKNVSVFADGQSGTGKSYTMLSGPDSVVPAAARLLFTNLEVMCANGWTFTTDCNVVEVLNGQINHLWPAPYEGNSPAESAVSSAEHLVNIITASASARHERVTRRNAISSRGHWVARVDMSARRLHPAETLVSSLFFVDLAGSERLPKDTSTPDATAKQETIRINRERTALRTLFVKRNDACPPYQGSTLTRVLRDCFARDSKILTIVGISPESDDVAVSMEAAEFCSTLKKQNTKSRGAKSSCLEK
ncbi:hypothetical protein MBLNU457_7834t3 [Dothideomycetes sp. NU457]